MAITGYGRGWQEPRAIGRWARFKQKLREPLTKTVLFASLSVFYAALVLMLLFAAA